MNFAKESGIMKKIGKSEGFTNDEQIKSEFINFMVNGTEKPVTPLSELQTMAFALQELALYLDTHRDDCEALDMYRAYQQMYHDAMKHYQENCRPLNHQTPVEGDYRWLDDPWPWEYARNKEC